MTIFCLITNIKKDKLAGCEQLDTHRCLLIFSISQMAIKLLSPCANGSPLLSN